MSAKAKNKLTPQQRKATLNRVLHKIRPYSAFVVCSLLVAAVSIHGGTGLGGGGQRSRSAVYPHPVRRCH